MRAGRAASGAPAELVQQLEGHRAELTGYCSRMLGSPVAAEDAVQETLVRAWRGRERFEGRGALRSWLYSIATNVCFDDLDGRRRRPAPIDLGPGGTAEAMLRPSVETRASLAPAPDAPVHDATDPAEVAVSRDEVRRAFVAVLRRLPPRQRAVLVLREVLHWQAKEVADLLGTTVPSVNSALQRARATLVTHPLDHTEALDDRGRATVARFADAFVRHDFDALVALLHADATRSRSVPKARHRGPPATRGTSRRRYSPDCGIWATASS